MSSMSSSSSSSQGPPASPHRLAGGGDCRILSREMPPDVLSDMVGYLDLSSRVRLAACTTFLQNHLFVQSRTHLWAELDFGKLRDEQKKKITDEHLRGLLERVDARNVTKKLSLFGCDRIRGHGLDPLRGSCVLKSINLSWANSADSATVANVLSTMPPVSTYRASGASSHDLQSPPGTALCPLGLKVVIFHTKDIATDEWADEFREAVQRFRPSECMRCHRAFSGPEAVTVENSWKGFSVRAEGFCNSCEMFTCGRDSCSTVTLCGAPECAKLQCSDCQLRVIRRCDCSNKFLELSECECCCDTAFCGDCSERHLSTCSECKAVVCDSCCRCLCDGCSKVFCGECDLVGDVSSCELCGERKCFACHSFSEYNHCDECGHPLCKDCTPHRTCSSCQKKFCPCLPVPWFDICKCGAGQLCSYCSEAGAKCPKCQNRGELVRC